MSAWATLPAASPVVTMFPGNGDDLVIPSATGGCA